MFVQKISTTFGIYNALQLCSQNIRLIRMVPLQKKPMVSIHSMVGNAQVLGPRRSSRENRGVSPVRMADMLIEAPLEGSDADPMTSKQAMDLTV